MYKDFKYIITSQDVIDEIQVKDVLRKRFDFSSRLITRIKKNKSIYVNGKLVPAWICPKEGDIITVSLPEEKSNFAPSDIPIDVVFEDNNILIINKPAGYVVHPTSSHQENTIANGITKYMQDTNQVFKLRFINRLDRDTSGLLMLGKNSFSQDQIVKQMKVNQVEKTYIALVHGKLSQSNGIIDLPIGRPEDGNIKRAVMKGGSNCKTIYKTKGVYRDDGGNLYSFLKIRLETGRTHQIRVHMSHIGHPLVSDLLYGEPSKLIDRQALHAIWLSFIHPVSGKKIDLKTPIPSDISNALENLNEVCI